MKMTRSSRNRKDNDGLHHQTNRDSSDCYLEVAVVLDGDCQKNDDVGDDDRVMTIACCDCDA